MNRSSYTNRVLTDIVGGNGEGEWTETWKRNLLPMTVKELLEFYMKNNVFPIKKAKLPLVYYPGCANDLFRMFLLTNCTTLIGADLFDPLFLPRYLGVDVRQKMDAATTTGVHLHAILKDFCKEIGLFSSVFPSMFGTNPITSVAFRGPRLEVRFTFKNVPRRLVVYSGLDANAIIPPELIGKRPDLLMQQGFQMQQKMIRKLDPRYTYSEPGQFTQGTHTKMVPIETVYMRPDIIGEPRMTDILVNQWEPISNNNNALKATFLPMKAHIIAESFDRSTYLVHYD